MLFLSLRHYSEERENLPKHLAEAEEAMAQATAAAEKAIALERVTNDELNDLHHEVGWCKLLGG